MKKYTSKRNFEKNQSVDKRYLWSSVNKRLNYKIHSAHVFAVINILFDQIIEELISGNSIQIGNLGVLKLKQMKPRMYHDLTVNKIVKSKGNKILRFCIAKKLTKVIIKNLNFDKTFRG